jgi:predicted DNA-binding protein
MTAANAAILQPKEKSEPKINISARLSIESVELLDDAAEKTGKTKSELVDECVKAGLGGKKGKAK